MKKKFFWTTVLAQNWSTCFFFNTIELLSACLLKICLWFCYHSNHLLPSFSLLFFPFLLQENRMERDRPGIEVTIVTVHDYYQEQEQ